MTALFLVSTLVLFYAYFGYPLLLACCRKRPTGCEGENSFPFVSVCMCVHDAEDQVLTKLENLSSLDYPKEKLEIIVVSDGSRDRTVELVEGFAGPVRIVLVESDENIGKSAAINLAVAEASGEVLFMVDVRQRIESGALRELVRLLRDPEVGAVSGELVLVDKLDPGRPLGLGLYWNFEKLVRKLESLTGSVIGVTGAIYAIRRELVPALPANLILDDVFIPLHVVRAGKRVLFTSRAAAFDSIADDQSIEFSRKVRTLYGNLELVQVAPWVLSRSNPVRFRFVSHKLLRLVIPFVLPLLLISAHWSNWALLNALFWLQVAGYVAAACAPAIKGTGVVVRVVSFARTFVMLNVASASAVIRFVSRKPVVWTATKMHKKDEVVEGRTVKI